MKILIAGAGKVGYTLAEQLAKEHHDVIIIDSDEGALRRASDNLDVMCIKGNSASFTTLREAGAPTADLMIAVTNHDEVNMISCLAAKNLGTGYTIARIRDADYTQELEQLQKALGIDLVINPELSTAVEITRLIRFPSADNIETFYRGRVELAGFQVQEKDFLAGKPLAELTQKVKDMPVLVCAAQRGEEIIIPNGGFVPRAGDRLYIVGKLFDVNRFFKLMDRYAPKIKSVFVTGGGRITGYLTALLLEMNMQVKVVELNEARCRALSERYPAALIIHGDGTDQSLLDSENMDHCDAFVALTDRDEDNLIISMYARLKGLPKVIVKSNRQNYAPIANAAGVGSLVSPKMLTAWRILQVVRGMENSKGSVMTALYKIADNQVEAAEFVASGATRHLGVPLRQLPLKKGILIAIIARHGAIIVPDGSAEILEGDTVIIVSQGKAVMDINDIYDPMARVAR